MVYILLSTHFFKSVALIVYECQITLKVNKSPLRAAGPYPVCSINHSWVLVKADPTKSIKV